MHLGRSSKFKRQLRKLPQDIQERAKARLVLFVEDQFHPLLNNHKLGWDYEGCRSINVTGDYRIIFILQDEETCLLLEIGTHPELYGN